MRLQEESELAKADLMAKEQKFANKQAFKQLLDKQSTKFRDEMLRLAVENQISHHLIADLSMHER